MCITDYTIRHLILSECQQSNINAGMFNLRINRDMYMEGCSYFSSLWYIILYHRHVPKNQTLTYKL